MIEFTEVTKSSGILTKIISLDENGELKKDGQQCKMGTGEGRTIKMPLSGYPSYLAGLKSNQAVVLGVNPAVNGQPYNIVSRKNFKEGQENTFTRTLDHIAWADRSMLLLDVDDLPDGMNALDILGEIIPGFSECGKVLTNSASAGIYSGDVLLSKKGGIHIYLSVADSSDIERFKDALFKRTWLSGYGKILITAAGIMLERSMLFDGGVFSPERLIFEASPVLQSGLTQSRPEPQFLDGGGLDTALLLDLNDAEQAEYESMVSAARADFQAEADRVRAAWKAERTVEIITRNPKLTKEQINKKLDGIFSEKAILPGCFLLHTKDHGTVSFQEMLDNPGRFDGCCMCDPLEPEYDGGHQDKAKFYANTGCINSFAHGGKIYHQEPATADREHKKKKSVLNLKKLKDLENKDFPEVKWIIPGILPEGGALFAGKPKMGKSVFALNLCVAVASGGMALGKMKVEQGTAIYFSLDDTSERRLKDRALSMCVGGIPEKLLYTTQVPRIGEGGLETLEKCLEEYPDTRLIVIDTLQRFRPLSKKKNGNQTLYQEDYDMLSGLNDIAIRIGACVLCVCHTRKAEADDIFDMISGSNGLSGAVDTITMLTRDKKNTPILSLRGREVEENTFRLSKDPEYMQWVFEGEYEFKDITDAQNEVLQAIRNNESGVSPKKIAEITGKTDSYVKKALPILIRKGFIVKEGRGLYVNAQGCN